MCWNRNGSESFKDVEVLDDNLMHCCMQTFDTNMKNLLQA